MKQTESSSSIGVHVELRTQHASTSDRLRYIWQYMKTRFATLISPPKPLHPDFTIRWYINDNLTWWQNFFWLMPESPYKVGFYISDVSELDNCPYVCKFGENLNTNFPEYPYFCVAYGDPNKWSTDFGLADMQRWVLKFSHPSVMKYDGSLVKML